MLFWREFTKDKIDVTNAGAELVVTGAKAKAWEIFGAEMLDGRFEAVVAACAAPLAEADLAEWQIKVITDN